MSSKVSSVDIYRMQFPSRKERLLQRMGLTNRHNLLWSWYEPRNFGDWIGPYLFAKMTGRLPLHSKPEPGRLSLEETTATVGSILRHIHVADRVTVWGSGIISRKDSFLRPKDVLAVRGPRTRARLIELGYPYSDVFGDPGLLMPRFYSARTPVHRSKLGIIPHHLHYNNACAMFANREDVSVIDVTQHIERVIDEIVSCECTLASSLHGLILSHAYNIPSTWMATQASSHGDDVKYIDYLESIGIFNVNSPANITRSMPLDELVGLASSLSVGDMHDLTQALLDACPFAPKQRIKDARAASQAP